METADGRNTLVAFERARWHKAKTLVIPPDLSLLHLPPFSSELNRMETAFQCLNNSFLANHRVFESEELKANVKGV